MNRSNRNGERGMALVTALVSAVVLVTIAAAALTYSRSDAMVSDNSKHGSAAIWIAQIGTERAKNELRDSDSARHWTKVASSTTFYASGTTYSGMPGAMYATVVTPYGVAGSGKFLIQSNGTAPDGSAVAIEEVVAFAGAALDLSAINIQGTGTHTKLDGGNNYGIPSYFVDGRNHDRNGIVCGADVDGNSLSDSATCTTPLTKYAIRGTTTTINNDVASEFGNLKQHMVNDALSGGTCNTAGSCNQAKTVSTTLNAGTWWLRNTSGLSAANCTQTQALTNPSCYWNLDLADARLNATGHASGVAPIVANATGDTTWNVMFQGPVIGGTFGYAVNGPEDNALRDAIEQIMNYAVNSNIGDRAAITGDISGGNTTYGTWAHPKVVIVCNPGHANAKMNRLGVEPPCNGAGNNNNNFLVSNNAVVTGTGLLIVGRTLQLNDARFNWRGIILILDEGRLQVKNGGNPDVRGMILGTVVVQDDTGSDPKLKLAYLTQTNSLANAFMNDPVPASHSAVYDTIYGFGVKYSAEAVANALSGAMTTLSWRESYRGE